MIVALIHISKILFPSELLYMFVIRRSGGGSEENNATCKLSEPPTEWFDLSYLLTAITSVG